MKQVVTSSVHLAEFLLEWSRKMNRDIDETREIYESLRKVFKGFVNEGRDIDLCNFLHLEKKDSPKERGYFNFYANKREVRKYDDRPYSYKARLSPYLKYPDTKE